MEIAADDILEARDQELEPGLATASTFPVVSDLVGVEQYPTVRIRVLDARRAKLRALVATTCGACATLLIAAAFTRTTSSADASRVSMAVASQAPPPAEQVKEPPPSVAASAPPHSSAWVPVAPTPAVSEGRRAHSSTKAKKAHR